MIPGWLEEIEEEVVTCLRAHGSLSARALAGHLGVSEASALSYIGHLAASGRLSIERVAVRQGAGNPPRLLRRPAA